jgi:mannosidase alpha-like ER degradation enhancer 1
VFVTDPKMEAYLPIPTTPPRALHDPAEVMLRFSTIASTGAKSVFLHAIASTATFGKEFGNAGQSGFGIGGLGMLLRPRANTDGCRPFKSGELPDIKGVVVMDRGGCTFLTKVLHAESAGMEGVFLIGLPVTPPGLVVQNPSTPGTDDEGLIRPSADGEPEELLHRVRRVGIVYVEHIVGQAVLRPLEVETKAVVVEMMRLEAEAEAQDLSRRETAVGRRGDGKRNEEREGRVMVNDWEVWNLRIVEQMT